jgi:hypothetical protein
MNARALKIGFGVGFLVVGLFVTIAGVALTALVGPDGRFEMPETTARTRGRALVFDAIYVRGNLPTSGSLSATLGIDVEAREDGDVFVGVGPTPRVHRYLADVAYGRVVRIDWPGGAGTEPVRGGRAPDGAPGDQGWWEASDEGPTASVGWTVRDGDWSVVIMNADASAGVDVAGSVEVALPILGPLAIGTLLFGLALIAIGVILTVRSARSPKDRPKQHGAAAPASPFAAASPPPRPDA